MNDVNQQLPLRLEDNSTSSSITSFLFYFLYFFIFMILCFFIISYLYPDSICRQIYNSLKIELSEKNVEKTAEKTAEKKSKKNDETTKQLEIPKNKKKISLDEAVDQYMILQNQTNNDLGKINYLPPKQYTNKEGWCWIGKDRGFNSCIEIGRNDYCMSGDIYPTKDICINPSLRL
jgi:hypothetical protein